MARRSEAGDLVERQIGAGGDHQIVIGHALPIRQFHPALRRMEAGGALGEQTNALSPHHRFEIDLDIAPLAPAHRYPRIGRGELEPRPLPDQGHAILGPHLLDRLECGQRAAEAGPQDHNLCHDAPRLAAVRPSMPVAASGRRVEKGAGERRAAVIRVDNICVYAYLRNYES
jgi:hypothetical protein